MSTNSREYARKYYAEHKEMFREASKRYQEKKKLEKKLRVTNPRLFDLREDYKTPTKEEFKAVAHEPQLTYSQKYYAENRERIRAQQKAARDKKKRAAKQRETRERNKKLAKQRAYYAENREKILEQQRKNWHKKQRQKKLSKTFLGRVILKFNSLFD